MVAEDHSKTYVLDDNGNAPENVNSLTVLPSEASLYATNQLGENVMRVDLATGDREVILDECLCCIYTRRLRASCSVQRSVLWCTSIGNPVRQ